MLPLLQKEKHYPPFSTHTKKTLNPPPFAETRLNNFCTVPFQYKRAGSDITCKYLPFHLSHCTQTLQLVPNVFKNVSKEMNEESVTSITTASVTMRCCINLSEKRFK